MLLRSTLVVLLVLAAIAPAQEVVARSQTGKCNMTRVLFFKRTPRFHIPVQYAITYGAPAWKSEYDRMLEGKEAQRFRLGKDWWTTFDTNRDLTVGGAKVPAGSYYLVLERTAKGSINLVALPTAEIRKKRLDAFQSPNTTGGIAIPMMHKKGDGDGAANLQITLAANPEDHNKGKVSINWGPHTLSARIEVHYDGK